MSNMEFKNLDLGRPITFGDIVANNVYPMQKADEGCYCYLCQRQTNDMSSLEPLTTSTGVFTQAVTCDMNSPVWVCLEHIPFFSQEFEAFTPQVQRQLIELRQLRDKEGS